MQEETKALMPEQEITQTEPGKDVYVGENETAQLEAPVDAKKTLTDYLNDENVQANARTVAENLETRFRGNWFTIDQVMKKTHFKDFKNAFDVLNILCLLGYSFREEKSKGVIKYKITLKSEDRVKLLELELATLEEKKLAIEGEIERLKNQPENK